MEAVLELNEAAGEHQRVVGWERRSGGGEEEGTNSARDDPENDEREAKSRRNTHLKCWSERSGGKKGGRDEMRPWLACGSWLPTTAFYFYKCWDSSRTAPTAKAQTMKLLNPN